MREEHRKNKASAALVLKAMWADIFGKTKKCQTRRNFLASFLESYYERAYRYVEENIDKPVLRKLRNNIPLTQEDWNSLEQIFCT